MFNRSLRSIALLGAAALAAPMAFADDYRVSGPYTHENLSVYLIHAAARVTKPSGKYLTLQEALDQKKVVVFETGNVNELSIENLGNMDVYIQSGDIVKGGRQDRVFPDDFILQSRSGKVPINAFCVEHGRWTRRGSESAEHFSASNQSLPNKSLKLAARGGNASQQRVWDEVEKTNADIAISSGYASANAPPSQSPTSMQMALENKQVSEATNRYVEALERVIEGRDDVVGYAFAVNGNLNSADVYSSHEMFTKMWPKLLQASAVEALTNQRSKAKVPAPEPAAVQQLMTRADSADAGKTKDVANRVVEVTKESDKVVEFETRDRKADGTWVHKSIVVK